MSAILPPARPEIARTTASAWLAHHGAEPLALIGRRAYYRDTMGVPGRNDLDIYDDAIVLLTPSRCLTFNANTDPSKLHPGVAVLAPGMYLYRVGTHNITKAVHLRYEALVQASAVTVRRHERAPETGWFGINIHRGSLRTTSSLGCQTIHPSQWPQFMAAVKDALAEVGRSVIPYVLTERDDA